MSEEKAIRIISFSGKRADWRVWSRKFLAVAEKRGYKKILTGALELSSTSSAEEKQLGVNAYNDLLLAMNESISFGLVDESTSAVSPEGDAGKAWKKLMNRYESQTSASKVKIMGQLHASRLTKKTKDPEAWISELEMLRSRLKEMGTDIDDEFLILHILNNLPSEYDNVVENLEERVDSVINPLGIEDVRQKLSEKFEKMKIRKKIKEDSEDEDDQALFTTKFKGRCNKCGKFGHKAKDCRSTSDTHQGKTKKFTGKCHHCRKMGHKEADCWAKHGKPTDNANTAEERGTVDVNDDNNIALISVEDFAGITFAEPDQTEKKIESKKIEGKVLDTIKAQAEEGPTETEKKIKNQVKEEVIPGVTADMVKPFNPEEWTAAMKEEFHRFTSHDYELDVEPEEQDDMKQGSDKKRRAETDTSLISKEKHDTKKTNQGQIWIGDTGASCHMTNSISGIINLQAIESNIMFGNGERLKATHIGDKEGYVLQKDGSRKPILLKKVKYVPKLTCNLLSISTALQNGCTMEGTSNKIKLKKGKREYVFDQKIRSGKGNLYGIRIIDYKNDKNDKAYLSINDIHEMLGHPSEEITKATAFKLNLKPTGKMMRCVHCDVGKMKKKNISKQQLDRAEKPGDRLFMDISSIKYASAGGAKFWALFVDDCTDFVFGVYMKKKSDLSIDGIKLINSIENNYGIKIKKIRCDNAGENKAFEEEIIDRGMKICFEYTAVNTPQQNGRVERKFATIYGRVRSMLTAAGIEGRLRHLLWAEAGNTAIHLMNIQTSHQNQKSPYELFAKKNTPPKYASNLKRFGEIGIILKPNKIKSKMLDRGQKAMMVGYGTQHGEGVYRMYKFDTGKITQTRDVRWIKQIYADADWSEKDNKSDSDDDSFESINEIKKEETEEEEINKEEKDEKKISTRLHNALRQLDTSYNPTLSALVYEDDIALVGGTDDTHENPTSFQEAWHHPDINERLAWRAAIRKEFRDMINRNVWRYAKRNRIPQNRRLIGNKWVFKKKRNGVYRARMVALGYAQIPGVDHKDNFSPVVSEIAFRTILILGMIYEWDFEIVDIETAFLYGELEEEIYMKVPEGLSIYLNVEYNDEDCVILDKSIYGLVQAARQFHRKLISVLMNEMNFKKCAGDECLLMRESESGTVVICVYIDDTLCAGPKKALDIFKAELRNFFATKEEGKMDEYVGCQIKRINRDCLVMHQKELMKKLERIFNDDIQALRSRKIPLGTNQRIIRPKEGEKLISKEEQTKYRSGIGMLLYLVKYSRPDLSNAVRELSKVNDGATKEHVQNLLRVIKFAIDTKNRVLVYKIVRGKEFAWVLKAYSDSDWAGDPEDRKSITGFCIFLNGCLISWKSRGQKTVTLSSSEAEYVAVADVCTEILFIKTILDFLGLKVKLPITVMCDNVGAIFMAHNLNQEQWTYEAHKYQISFHPRIYH